MSDRASEADGPVERHAGRQTERLPSDERRGLPGGAAVPVLGPGDFNDAEETVSQHDSDPPPPMPGGVLPPAETSDLHERPSDLPPPPPIGPADAFAEFETEMQGESTRIEESDLLADQSTAILDEGPKLPYLFVESGKDKDKEYVLQEGETGVGRGIDNDVILTDVSVSRKHLRVLREGANLVLKDLGSGNGTTVNARRVHQVALVEGDRIELGETVLVVRTPALSAAAIASVSPETHHTALPLVDPRLPAVQMIPASWPSAPMAQPDTGASRDGNTATVRLPRRTLLVAGAIVAILASMIGATVGVMILSQRTETVTSLPTTTPVVVVSGTGQPQTIQIPTTPPPVTAPVVAPTPVATPTPVAEAVAPVAPSEPVATTPTPTTPATTTAPATVATATTRPTTTPTTSTRSTTPTTSSSSATRATRAPRETSGPAASAQGRILAAYRTGDFDGAAAIARQAASASSGDDRRELEQTATEIDNFASLYPSIRSAGDSGVGTVARSIPVALNLDRHIAPPSGIYARELTPRYVRWLVSSARSQMGSAPGPACRQVRSALDLDGSNGDAQALARQCESAAQRMITEARGREARDAAGARSTYEAVQQMVPRSSSSFSAAQERIAAMRRARPVDEDE